MSTSAAHPPSPSSMLSEKSENFAREALRDNLKNFARSLARLNDAERDLISLLGGLEETLAAVPQQSSLEGPSLSEERFQAVPSPPRITPFQQPHPTKVLRARRRSRLL
ncbi:MULTISPECIES: hypothetical protein [unclassified Adlercreutzia]|uniref:hypothetical protein n=1 Tax=unclassified Adlercreutzia TaxID=2636013 RepID=UPI0013EB078D|nr:MULTISPECIES: hypothetical protein [unclassified Adlercreutzia]